MSLLSGEAKDKSGKVLKEGMFKVPSDHSYFTDRWTRELVDKVYIGRFLHRMMGLGYVLAGHPRIEEWHLPMEDKNWHPFAAEGQRVMVVRAWFRPKPRPAKVYIEIPDDLVERVQDGFYEEVYGKKTQDRLEKHINEATTE